MKINRLMQVSWVSAWLCVAATASAGSLPSAPPGGHSAAASPLPAPAPQCGGDEDDDDGDEDGDDDEGGETRLCGGDSDDDGGDEDDDDDGDETRAPVR